MGKHVVCLCEFGQINETEQCVHILIKYATITSHIYKLVKSEKEANKQILYNKIIEDSWHTYYPLIHTRVMDLFIQDENHKNKFNCIDDNKAINEINNVASLAMHTSLNGKVLKYLSRGAPTVQSKYK